MNNESDTITRKTPAWVHFVMFILAVGHILILGVAVGEFQWLDKYLRAIPVYIQLLGGIGFSLFSLVIVGVFESLGISNYCKKEEELSLYRQKPPGQHKINLFIAATIIGAMIVLMVFCAGIY